MSIWKDKNHISNVVSDFSYVLYKEGKGFLASKQTELHYQFTDDMNKVKIYKCFNKASKMALRLKCEIGSYLYKSTVEMRFIETKKPKKVKKCYVDPWNIS